MKETFQRFKNYDNIYHLPNSTILIPPFIYKKIVRMMKGDILDIGGATGEKLLNLLENVNYNNIKSIDLIEPSPLYIKAAQNLRKYRKINVYNKELIDLANEQKKYDVILFFEVIEHLKEPEKAIDIIKKILKPEGVLILSTPNKYVYHFLSYLEREPIDPTHVSEMTFKELRNLMDRKFKKNYYFAFFPIMFLIRKFPFLDIINKIYKNFYYLSRTIYSFSSDNNLFNIP